MRPDEGKVNCPAGAREVGLGHIGSYRVVPQYQVRNATGTPAKQNPRRCMCSGGEWFGYLPAMDRFSTRT